eukprot:TRINITY_DN6737_c0_g1_i2.p1 TRINITY_DN6737_c0_g1~~TRINITY_DN6737_c0_g1_i2.p1  ORF type:complete len:199 (-),score=29.49 TRINITY_DN6737_c0_g1_i2:48-644(-)
MASHLLSRRSLRNRLNKKSQIRTYGTQMQRLPMNIEFLGTGSTPTKDRNVSSIALKIAGETWLFDCGEGTQQQLLKSTSSASRIDKIFITNLRGDHVWGLPGVIASRKSTEPLYLFGPHGIKEFLKSTMRSTFTRPLFPLRVCELILDPSNPPRNTVVCNPTCQLVSHDSYKVEAATLTHKIQCFGYVVTEPTFSGSR